MGGEKNCGPNLRRKLAEGAGNISGLDAGASVALKDKQALGHRVQRKGLTAAAAPGGGFLAQAVDGPAPGDGHKPGDRAAAHSLVPVGLLPALDEDVLDDLFRGLPVRQCLERDVKDKTSVSFVETLEGQVVATGGGCYKELVLAR